MTAKQRAAWQLSEERRISFAQRRLAEQIASRAWWSCPKASSRASVTVTNRKTPELWRVARLFGRAGRHNG